MLPNSSKSLKNDGETILNSQQFVLDHAREDEHEESDHVDEKWLVSYADLMTLLFGLFVMLYVLAMETQGDPNKILKQNQSGNVSVGLPNEVENMKKEIASLREENSKLSGLSSELEIKDNEINGLKLKIAELDTKRLPANELEENKNQDLIKKIELQAQSLNKKNQELQMRIDELALKQPQSYFMIMSKWSTEKHDVDMLVTDPNGHVFKFNKRNFKGIPGTFEIDSRMGPGLELWKALSPVPGEYKVDLTLYKNYGNEVKTNLELQLITPYEVLDKNNITLDLQSQKTQRFTFILDAQSRVKEVKEMVRSSENAKD